MDVIHALFAWVWAAVILLGMIDTAMILYAVNKMLEPLESHFKQQLYISKHYDVSGGGLYGKIIQLAVISALISSRKNQNEQPLLKETVQGLSSKLRFWATYPFYIAYFVTGASISLWLYGKYSGLLG